MNEETLAFNSREQISVRALLVGERIDTRALEKTSLLSTNPITMTVTEIGFAVLFRYGVVAFFDVAPLDEVAFLKHLKSFIINPLEGQFSEEIAINVEDQVKERVHNDTIYLSENSLEHCQLIAEILARTVVLDYYESRVDKSFDLVEPIAKSLREKGTRGAHAKELLRHMGEVLIIQHNMVGRVEVSEKPDLLWDNPGLERLYSRLEDEFEINERHVAVERKLALIGQTAETVLNLIQTKGSMRLEWYIIILIIMEILLSLYELFFR